MSDAVFLLERAVLNGLAGDAPLPELLRRLAEDIEAILDDVRVSIQRIDGHGKLRAGASPSLDPDYLALIEGESIGPKAGSCGTAAFIREPVVVSDVRTDPRWENYKTLGDRFGFRACWSFPVLGDRREVLGTFALYRAEPGLPDAEEQGLIARCAELVHLIMAREQRQAEIDLLRRGFDRSLVPMLLIDDSGRIDLANPALCRLLGIATAQLRGQSLMSLIGLVERLEVLEELQAIIKQNLNWHGELAMLDADGAAVPLDVMVTPIGNDHRDVAHFMVSLTDLRERLRAEAELERLAFHDPVTGLPNRSLFEDRLSMALATSRRERQHGALLFVDLDHFKMVNDLHGHSQGDALLVAVADRLRLSLREEDTVARLGGDEFVVLCSRLGADPLVAARRARMLADKLVAELVQPLQIRGHSHALTASVGITVFPKGLETGEDLLREADTAMYRAKESGRNAVALFDPQMQSVLRERDALERDLRQALQRREFALHLQPQVDQDGRVCAAEALLRWQHPERGNVPPLNFIRLAEECGLIVPLGDWVLEQVCTWLARCATAGRPLHMAVNVSVRQFREPNFLARVEQILRQSGADPLHLTLEVTESLLIDDAEASVDIMSALAKLGVRFSIDDFGIGYSSLSYLRRLPLREIKIDKSFVQDIVDNADDAALVQTMLSMAKHLRLTVVAEGVETQAQRDLLCQWGCQRLQGYLIDRPSDGALWVERWLAASVAAPP
ncbi:sensor domain-containing phosphodiesterase [Pseudomarimonas arenosa]|uniref:cyclic-guanylate-specific phosphodiesterase n=1 Tax=Pseudomarimonas arenosa TaxID=2774145 RepID=A0AAW3ZCX6_9GAMM|nr:EAL domain-containing protein [Pseudomarimonas arenosa]MBD8524173.1 EAL domain-containing protein [Pseudomarimonas arenosa]